MGERKFQVFISSTFRDLIEERQAVITNILDLGHIPAGMELFPAADVDQFEYIKKVIDECDYYVLIIGARYGSVDAEGISYTEKEYDYAVASKKFVIALIHGSPESIATGKSDVDAELKRALDAFREKASKSRLVRDWTSRHDLEVKVLKALNYAFHNHPQVGWIRGDAADNEKLLRQISSLLEENTKLKEDLAKDPLKPNLEAVEFDLSFFDEVILVKYSQNVFEQTKGGSSSISMTWRDVFVGVGSKLETPASQRVIDDGIRAILRDKGYAAELYHLESMTRTRIRARLIKSGLVMPVEPREGGTRAQDLLVLTKGGLEILREIILDDIKK